MVEFYASLIKMHFNRKKHYSISLRWIMNLIFYYDNN